MKTTTSIIRTPVLLLWLLALALASGAWAGQGLHGPARTCEGANCKSVVLYGVYDVLTLNEDTAIADCFQEQLFTAGDECVRLHVDKVDPGVDLEMVLVCPDGTVWRNDDTRPGDRRPLIKAETPTGRAGWCTVQICHYAGRGEPITEFRLRYGRYNLGNRNCANPTAPLVEPSAFFSPLESSEEKE